MQDYYSSCVRAQYQPSLLCLTQYLANQANHAADRPTDAEVIDNEPRERRLALVVDDVADVTEMLAVVLTHAGYSVVTAASAAAALNAARERQFDVIISDIGYSMFDDKERSTKAGLNAHMTKPIDPRALLDLIEQL